MYEQSNGAGDREAQLEASVERLTKEVASLKLELATLVSAHRESQGRHHWPRPVVTQRTPQKPIPASRPSSAPAAVVVLLATALLSWQLITGPRADGAPQEAKTAARVSAPRQAQPAAPPPQVTLDTPTDPPITPLVTPTVYKGTLAINADRPGARVYVNRREVGIAPVRVRNLKAGAHLVWIESEGFRRWTRVVTVPAERVTRVSADLEPVEPVIEY